MKITDNRRTPVTFEKLKAGDAFSYNRDIYLRIEETYSNVDGDYENAVLLKNGKLEYFDDDIDVMPVTAELLIS